MCYNIHPVNNRPAHLPRTQAFAGVLLLGVFLLACRVSVSPRSWPEFEPGSLLFQDDFSDPESGWDRVPEALHGSLDYQDQAYRISVAGEHQMLWSGPGLEFRDARLEVDAQHRGEARDDDFGFICRAQDDQNFYYLVVSSDGYYGIGKVVDGETALIGVQAMPPSEAIVRGPASNHLRADCIGDTLSLYANGLRLASVRDDEFEHGEVGLLAGTIGALETEVFFDNFSVVNP